MNTVAFTLNGRAVTAEVEPRTHLADFLRERLHLTGTHLGCEHGVCGACTLLLDGAPARSCITFAAGCGGRDIRSIEGLQDDPVTAALRQAFKAEHALQCGYCTPGMLVTARDIVLRLPHADAARVRLELAGNLCRCTGYDGIVKAIRRVLALRLNETMPPRLALATIAFPEVEAAASIAAAPILAASAAPRPDGRMLVQRLSLGVPRDAVWAALQDPALVASCVPGARLTNVAGDRIEGEMLIALGPIQGRFTGAATVAYDQAGFAGTMRGEGRDQASGTRLSADAQFAVTETAAGASLLTLTMSYALRGALAQFARAAVVQAFADEIAILVGRNLEARLRGDAVTVAAPRLSAARLARAVVWRWLKVLLTRRK